MSTVPSFSPSFRRALRFSAGAFLFALTPACWHTGSSSSDDGGSTAMSGSGGLGGGVGGAGGTGGSSAGSGTGASPPVGGANASGGSAGVSPGAGAGGASSAGVGGGGSTSGGSGGVGSGAGGATSGAAGMGVAGAPQPMATCMGSFETAAVDGMQHSIAVDSASNKGDLPHFWNTFGTGEMPLFLNTARSAGSKTWGELLKDHVTDGVQNLGVKSLRQHGLFHDDIGIYHEVNGAPVYDFTKSDQIFDFFVALHLEPIVELAPMPRDLAADPSKTVFDWNMIISLPKDFARWQELVTKFVQHSVERYGADVVNRWYFEVWNEPECCSNKFWSGTIDQYFELYDHAAAGVRAALPTGRVGGPVNSQPVELTKNSMIGQKFLQHVTTDNYVTPGKPGVLDFFAYHSWSFIDGSINGYFQGLDLLDSFNLQSTRIAITEYGPTYEFNLTDEPQEMDQGAAFAVQTYADIVQKCTKDNRRLPIAYSWWVLSDVFDETAYRDNDPFIGCMGLTSRENIHKPVYNAYKFLAQMGTQQVAGVGGMATRSADGGVELILYNAQNPGKGPTNDTYYEVTDAHTIGVTVSGLDPAFPFDVTAYRVDHVTGNAYTAWQGLGRPSMTAMTDANWQSFRDVMDSPAEPLGRALCGTTFTHAFTLQSPGVLFVKLSPAAP